MTTFVDGHLSGGGWLRVFLDPERAGGVAVNFAVDEFAQTPGSLEERGFDGSAATTTPPASSCSRLTTPTATS